MQIPVKFDYFLVEKPWSINIKHEHKTFQSLCFSKMRDHDYCLQEPILIFLPNFSCTTDIPPLKTKLKHILSMKLEMAGVFFIVLEKMQSTKELTLRKYN